MYQKSIKNRYKKRSNNLCIFEWIFDRLGKGFGGQVGAKMPPKSTQNRFKKLYKKLSPLASIFVDFDLQLVGPGGSRGSNELGFRHLFGSWTHLGTKMASRSLQESPQDRFWRMLDPNFIDFWLSFHWFLAQFLIDFGSPASPASPALNLRHGGGAGPQGNWIYPPPSPWGEHGVLDLFQVLAKFVQVLQNPCRQLSALQDFRNILGPLGTSWDLLGGWLFV